MDGDKGQGLEVLWRWPDSGTGDKGAGEAGHEEAFQETCSSGHVWLAHCTDHPLGQPWQSGSSVS